MTILDTLITDRTPEDVERAIAVCAKGWDGMTRAERTAFLDGLKGGYGPTDMNRVRGALEYIDHLMRDAKRESVFQPVPIDHAEYNGTAWRRWADVVAIASDYVGPDIYLENINRLWEAARRFEAVALSRYDPDGNGYLKPGRSVDAGKMFRVTDSVGLLELRVACAGPPGITAQGVAWTVEPSETGWTARLDYSDCPYMDLDDALAALVISCGEDAIVDGLFTLSATLRYGYDVTAGTCAVRWSPFITWDEARALYKTWDGTAGLTWDLTARGRMWPRIGRGWFAINFDADYKKE